MRACLPLCRYVMLDHKTQHTTNNHHALQEELPTVPGAFEALQALKAKGG